MQPFRITCETCRSRLKIRSADVIGQIHACPKCGSMVQVVPPAGWDASSAALATEQASAPTDAALTLSTTASGIFPANALDDLSEVTAALETPAVEAPAEVALSPALPPAATGSPVMMWTLGGVASALVLGVLAWAVWPSGGDKVAQTAPTATAGNDHQAPVDQVEEPNPPTPAIDQPKPNASSTDEVPAKADADLAPQTAETKSIVPPVAVDSDLNAKKSTEPVPPTPSLASEKTDTATSKVSSKVAIVEPKLTDVAPAAAPKPAVPAPDHSPVLKFDPLDFDVDRLGSNAKAESDAAASTSSIPDKLPADSAPVVAAEPDKPPVSTETAPLNVANNGITVRRGLPSDGPQHAASQILAARVKSFQVTDMPLARFVETASGVAGIGITLDPIALEQVGIAPQATVSVNAQDTALQSILRDGLGQRRLDIAEQGGQLRVVLPKGDEPHEIDYDVKDLAIGADAAAVGQLIERFVAPTTWKSAGGKGKLTVSGTTLHIEQSDAVRRQVVVFCERLRLARGLSAQSKYPAALLSVESPYQRLSAKLTAPATFTFLPWKRLEDVTRSWQELSGLAVFVDWGALAEAELGPASPIACSANDRNWQESFDGVLEPLGLSWWAVNGESIQITSLAALERIQRIEFYQVPPKMRASFATNQALIESLQKELAGAAGKQGKPAATHMQIDEPSGRLIVIATPDTHRHLAHRLARP